MKRISSLLFLAMLVFVLGAPAADSWKGAISDKMCGADHHGQDPVECTRSCVKNGSSYVFVIAKDKILDIENQKEAKISGLLYKFAGKNVTVTGSLSADGKSVKIESIK